MNDDLPDQLIEDFLLNLEKVIDRLESEYESENFSQIQRLGHALYGSGATHGFDEISEISGQLEEAAQHQETEDIKTLLDQLKQEYERIQDERVQETC